MTAFVSNPPEVSRVPHISILRCGKAQTSTHLFPFRHISRGAPPKLRLGGISHTSTLSSRVVIARFSGRKTLAPVARLGFRSRSKPKAPAGGVRKPHSVQIITTNPTTPKSLVPHLSSAWVGFRTHLSSENPNAARPRQQTTGLLEMRKGRMTTPSPRKEREAFMPQIVCKPAHPAASLNNVFNVLEACNWQSQSRVTAQSHTTADRPLQHSLPMKDSRFQSAEAYV